MTNPKTVKEMTEQTRANFNTLQTLIFTQKLSVPKDVKEIISGYIEKEIKSRTYYAVGLPVITAQIKESFLPTDEYISRDLTTITILKEAFPNNRMMRVFTDYEEAKRFVKHKQYAISTITSAFQPTSSAPIITFQLSEPLVLDEDIRLEKRAIKNPDFRQMKTPYGDDYDYEALRQNDQTEFEFFPGILFTIFKNNQSKELSSGIRYMKADFPMANNLSIDLEATKPTPEAGSSRCSVM